MIRASLKSLLARKLRLLTSTLAVVLGVAFVAGSLVFSDTLSRSFTALFDSNVGDVVVQPRGGTTADGSPSALTVPAAEVARLRRVPGVARADGRVSAFGVFVIGRDGKVVGGFGPPGLGGGWSDAPPASGSGLTVVRGDAPRRAAEVVLDVRTAERAGYAIGDRVPVITSTVASSGAVTSGSRDVDPQVRPVLVGLSDYPDGGSLNGATLASFTTRRAQQLFLGGRDAFTSIWVTARPGVSQEELRSAVAERLPRGLVALTGEQAADQQASDVLQAVSFLTTFLLIFAGIALVVGGFLIVNTFSILVAQRSRELALLRALGASKRQVTASVLLESFVMGLLGSTAGLGLGVLLALAIRALFGRVGLDLSGQALVYAPRTFVAAYAVGVLVTMTAAWLPARRTARITPVQALRDDVALPESSLQRRWAVGVAAISAGLVLLWGVLFRELDHGRYVLGGGIFLVLMGVTAASPVLSRPFLAVARAAYARVFGAVGNLAGQNSLRNPRRTTATASALMIGLALACTMSIVGDSAKATVDEAISDNFVGDYVVSNVFGGPFSPVIGDRMERVGGVQRVVRERYARAVVVGHGGGPQGLTATDPRDVRALGLDVVAGSRAALTRGRVLVQRSWAEDEGVAVGDRLTLAVPVGRRSVVVGGVFEDNPVVFFPVVMGLQQMAEAGFRESDNALIVFTRDGPSVQHRLEQVVRHLPVVTVKDQAEFAQEQRGPIDRLVLMIFALLGLALVIAVLGIVNTLALSVIERTREVGLLRAIGLGRGQLRSMVTLESVVIALLGAVLGVVLGIGFGVAIVRTLRDEGLSVTSVPAGQVALFLAASVAVGVLAAVLPARRAARLDVLRAIAQE